MKHSAKCVFGLLSPPPLMFLVLYLQSEDKVKPVIVVPGHLQALEHVVRQDYFPKESVAVLEAFMSR